MTMLLTEQQARLALEFSDHAIILDRGRVVHAAPSQELLKDPTGCRRFWASPDKFRPAAPAA